MRYQSGIGVNFYRSMPGWLMLDRRRAEIGSGNPGGFITSGGGMRVTNVKSGIVTFDFYWSSVTNDGRQILNV